MRNRIVLRLVIALATMLILGGCSDQKIIEDLGLVRTISYDLIEDVNPKDKTRITYTVPLASSKDKVTFTTDAKTSKQARVLFSLQNDRTIVSGQLRQVLFSKDLAKHGIWDHIDGLLRDPSIGRTVYVALVEGEAKELIEKPYKQDPSSGEYIYDMLNRAFILTDVPKSDLHSFGRDYYDEFTDPVVPILKLEKNYARIKGVAFFRNDRYITEIEQQKNIIFTSLGENLHTGELSISIKKKEEGDADGSEDAIILGYIESKRKIKVHTNGDPTANKGIHVQINVKMAGSLLDYTGELDLSVPANQRKLEKTIARQITQEAKAIIKQTQDYKVDPIGIGQYVRNHLPYEKMKGLDWHEVYPNIKVDVHYEVHIKEYGKMQ